MRAHYCEYHTAVGRILKRMIVLRPAQYESRGQSLTTDYLATGIWKHVRKNSEHLRYC